MNVATKLILTAKEQLDNLINKANIVKTQIEEKITDNKKLIEENSVITKDEFNSSIKNMEDINNGIHRLNWFATSTSISVDSNGLPKTPNSMSYEHLKWQGVDQTLVIMVNTHKTYHGLIVDGKHCTLQTMPDSYVKDLIENCINAYGIKTNMLKPHMGVNWSDGTTRFNLNYGTNTPAVLQEWKAVLLKYAQICKDYSIPILCIGCEQRQMTTSQYKYCWEDIVSTLRTQFPELKLTYACDSVEGVLYTTSCIYELDIDYIGLNIYPQWSPKEYDGKMTYKDLMPSAYTYYAPTGSGFHIMDRASYIYENFGKKVYLTEIGLMPYKDGLQYLLAENRFDKTAPRDYRVPAIAYESIFNTYAKSPYIVGISLWALGHPFCYFDYDDESLGEVYSPAEEVIKKYLESGEIIDNK